MVEVEVHSRETIQPSSPTPPHSRKFDLSGLDQLIPPVYTSVIFYYTMNNFRLGGRDNGEEISSKLRESLSETLSQFYPLAGRIRANLYIECNDEGALYSEARVNCRLEEFLSAPDLEALDGFLPFHTICTVPEEEAVQVAVQVMHRQLSISCSLTFLVLFKPFIYYLELYIKDKLVDRIITLSNKGEILSSQKKIQEKFYLIKKKN